MIIPKILKETITYDGYLKIKEADLEYPNKEKSINSKIEKFNAVSALVWNEDNETFLFTKQFRYPIMSDLDTTSILEIVAGNIEQNESPEESIKREILEEIGYDCKNIDFIQFVYSSPGYSSEKIYLYIGTVKNIDKIEKGGGLAYENEFIEIEEIKIEKVYEMLETHQIIDAKTLICLQYFKEKHFKSIISILENEKEIANTKIEELGMKLVLMQSKPKI